MNNLFTAYKVVPDAMFKTFIQNEEDTYDRGGDITETQLMDLAQNKYQTLNDRNEWNAPTPDQEKIIALESEVAKFTKALKNKKKNTPDAGGKPPGKSKDGKQGPGRREYKEPASWKLKPPGKGDKHTKKVNKKTFNWCKNHKMWTVHTTAECKGVAPKGEGKKPGTTDSENDESGKQKLKVNVSALMADDDDE
jgi:hypothetical protein